MPKWVERCVARGMKMHGKAEAKQRCYGAYAKQMKAAGKAMHREKKGR